MSFKKQFGGAVAVAATLLVCGCGVKLGEAAPEEKSVAYSGKGYGCLSQIPQHMEKYINDEMDEKEINDFIRCMQRAFTSFAQLTHGRDQATYAPEEIRRFLQSYFLKDRKISDGLLHEFMVIKQSLVGGDEGRIARTELMDAVEILEDLRVEAIRLKPHIKFLTPKLVVQQDPRDLGVHLSAANEALKHSIQVFSNRLQKSKKVYPLANLGNFLTEFRDFVRWEDHFKNSHKVSDWITLLKAFKEVTVSPVDPDVIRESEWVPLLQAMSGWYLSYLQYRTGIRNQPILYGVGLRNTVYLGDEVFDLMRTALRRRPGMSVSFEEINRLFSALHGIGWLPKNLRPSSLDQAVRAFATRMVGDGSPGGINLKTVSNMEREFYRWAYVQMHLDANYRHETLRMENVVPNLQARVPLFAGLRGKEDAQMQRSAADWVEFSKVKKLMRPLFSDAVPPRVWIVPTSSLEAYGVRHGFTNLSIMNLIRSVMGLVYQGYSSESPPRSLWDWGIKGPEMQAFYMDFRELGIDLQLIDKRNINSGSRAFVEGKLFTYSSKGLLFNGNDGAQGSLNFVEAMEYFAFLYSGGELSEQIYYDLAANCKNGPADINGKPKVLRACAENHLPHLLDGRPPFNYVFNMPGIPAYIYRSNPQVRYGFARILLETARSPASDADWVERNEISTMAVVLHYIESVMTRYDSNQDGILTSSELEQAVPVFAGFIKKIALDTQGIALSDGEAHAAFYFILEYKTIPTGWNYPQIIKNRIWTPDLALDREQLASVFRAIIGKLFEVGKKPGS